MNELCDTYTSYGRHSAIGKMTYGLTSYVKRTIFVNERPKLIDGKVANMVYFKNNSKYKGKIIRKPWNYAEQRHTLVHELTHYRFPSMRCCTRKFDDRIREILRGRIFEPNHTHSFAGSSEEFTILVSGATEEEIQKYHETQRKSKATREETNRKRRLYWQVHRQLKNKIKDLDIMTQAEVNEMLERTRYRGTPIEPRIQELQKKLDELTTAEGRN